MRLAIIALTVALAVGCASDTRQATQADPVTTTRATQATTRAARTTTTTDPDLKTCELFCERLNDTIQVIVDDYQAGRVDGHTGLGSIRLALPTMEGLDCGRFSSVAAREMANMDQTLRSAGY